MALPFKEINGCNQSLRRKLHTSQVTQLCCREKEAQIVADFIKSNIQEETNSSLYISGAPGSGKTAVVTFELEKLKKEIRYLKCITLNCMRLPTPTQFFAFLLKEINPKSSTSGSINHKTVEAILYKRSLKQPLVLIVDEIDQLGSRNRETIYTVFSWPKLLPCRILVIGIANSLNFTDSLLPKLQLTDHKPQLLHFSPYTPSQINEIVVNRFKELSTDQDPKASAKMDEMAVQYCAKKVAAASGDVRNALDICRRSIELAQSEARRQPANGSPQVKNKILSASPSIRHVNRAIQEAHSGTSYASPMGESSCHELPLQHQLVLAAAYLLRRLGQREVTLGSLHDKYSSLCRERQVGAVDTSEFSSICQLIEARGLFKCRAATEVRMTKLSLRTDDKGLESKLSDKPLLSAVLNK